MAILLKSVMQVKDYFSMFAGYNRWANDRLYDATDQLDDAQYRADRGAFFGSVHATLNHLLLADRIWMHRFTGTGETYPKLDLVLFDDRAALRGARIEEDERIAAWIDGLDDAAMAGTFSYRTVSNPADITQRLAPALAHFFNHQTHHRGQVHGLLTGFGIDAPSLDLIRFQRETGIGL